MRWAEPELRRAWSALALAAALLLALLAGCGRSARQSLPGDRISGDKLTIYLSMPFDGDATPDAVAIVNAARLALADVRGRIGRYEISLHVLNDALAQRSWDPGQTTLDARRASTDPTTIGYIGELNSGASAISIPILNRLGIPQVSPTSTAVGLTSAAAGAAPGEPDKYYPTRRRTFARVVPDDAVQARVQARLQRDVGCRKVYVVDDGEVDGQDMADSFQLVARSEGLNVVGVQAFPRRSRSYAPFAASVAQSAPDCVLISATVDSGAAAVASQLAVALPDAELFGTADLAEPAFIDPRMGGIPLASDSRFTLTIPSLGAQGGPVAARFYAEYSRRYGDPPPTAVLGYEAMGLMLSAISRATDHGEHQARRSKVVQALFSTQNRPSVLGSYSINGYGNTTIDRYGVYRIVAGGLRFWKALAG